MEAKSFLALGVALPELLVPRQRTALDTWCVIACDQYTSDRAYWQGVERAIGNAPSTLHAILPEVYLEDEGVEARIGTACAAMHRMQDEGAFETLPPGFMLVERTLPPHNRTRVGLLMALDLERYDYAPGAKTLIRATEGTISSRIPPRLRIRKNAPLEFPHIMVLIDDPQHTVIAPLYEDRGGLPKIYDGALGFSMGHIRGYHVGADRAEAVRSALFTLYQGLKAPEGGDPMLFAMGDGNHSLATARAHWLGVRETIDEDERETHPARFALCEVVNIHDPGLQVEAIHRVAFRAGGEAALDRALADARADGVEASRAPFEGAVRVDIVRLSATTPLYLRDASNGAVAGAVDKVLARLGERNEGMVVDYIHGEAETVALSSAPDTVGFVLPALDKADIFAKVSLHGPLPRKTFSLGEANEKRCYLEARRIVRV